MLSVLRISVEVLASVVAAIALQATSAASAVSAVATADTCAFTTTGHKIGCIKDAGYCDLIDVWRKGEWVFAGQEISPKDPQLPDPSVAARQLRPGVWAVVSWPDRRRLGKVNATNGQRTRWRIKNRSGRVLATARGSDGAGIGMLILYYDRDIFC